MRNKLHDLIFDGMVKYVEAGELSVHVDAEAFADYLISHGVTFKDVPETNVGKWIPVSVGLPGEEGVYIIRSDAGSVYTSHFYREKTFASGYCRPSTWTPRGKTKVTHWMPMPEPPKENANDTD